MNISEQFRKSRQVGVSKMINAFVINVTKNVERVILYVVIKHRAIQKINSDIPNLNQLNI